MKIQKEVRSVGEFLTAVSDTRDRWQVKNSKELWFRGEGKDYEETKLRPGLYRPLDGKSLKGPLDLIDIEDELFTHFRPCSTELGRSEASGDNSDDWSEYFQMQHHLAPTRLLDCSDGALIALHFALRKETLSSDEHRQESRRVYLLDPYWLAENIRIDSDDYMAAKNAWNVFRQDNPNSELDEDDWDECWSPNEGGHSDLPIPRFPLVLDIDHTTRRISAQRSRFILMGSEPDYINRMSERDDARIEAVPIASDAKITAKMRVELRDAGITESVIFPDLDGLGHEIRQLWVERLQYAM